MTNLEVPIFLNQLMCIIFASALPLLIIMYVLRVVIRSARKVVRSTYRD